MPSLLHQPPVRQVARRLAGLEVVPRGGHVGRDGLHPLGDLVPFVFGAEQPAVERPASAASASRRRGTARRRRCRWPARASPGRAGAGGNRSGPAPPRSRSAAAGSAWPAPASAGSVRSPLWKRLLDLQARRRPVAQAAVDAGSVGAVAVAAQVGGRDRVQLEGLEEIPVADGEEARRLPRSALGPAQAPTWRRMPNAAAAWAERMTK